MGLGGYLTWTAAAREICTKNPGLRVFPVEVHGPLIRPIRSEIFKNNPWIVQDFSESNSDFCIPMILNNPETNYCKSDTPEKAIHRYDSHIIEQICEHYGIKDPKLKCDIFLTDTENENVGRLISQHIGNKEFVVIDPSCNKEYTANKFDQFETWQKVVDNCSTTFVQVGIKNTKVLSGVIDMTGLTTFREAAGIISRSKMFVGSEGGLVHASTSFCVPCVVVMTGFIHPRLVSYPGHEVIWATDEHGPCGMKVHCEECTRGSKSLEYYEILGRIDKVMQRTET